MKFKNYRSHLLRAIGLTLLFVSALWTMAQKVDKSSWEMLEQEYNYQEEQKEETKPKEETKKEKSDRDVTAKKSFKNFNFNDKPIRILIYLAVFLLLVYLIFALIKNGTGGQWKNTKLKTTFDIHEPDELEKSELDKALEEASSSGDFNKALRLHFLLLLESLGQKRLIHWHKHKTNGEYLHELKDYADLNSIVYLTYQYEYYWYGEHVLSQANYETLSKYFTSKSNQISGHE